MKNSIKTLALLPFVLPAAALAHTGGHMTENFSSQLLAGAVHALSGLDHMLGAIMAGACIALALQHGTKTLAQTLPVALFAAVGFIASALLGSLIPAELASVAEWAVLASLVVMIVAIATGLKQRGQPLALAAVLVTALASCHALAHGAELAAEPLLSVTSFAVGACSLLLVVGSISAIALKRILARFTLAKL